MIPVHKRGLDAPYAEQFFGDRLAVSECEGADHGILIWHKCPTEEGWIAAGVGLHTRTGGLANLTLRASLLFECCGMHGYLTDGVWQDC